MKRFIAVAIFGLIAGVCIGQTHKTSVKILKLINEARVNPTLFLKTYKTEIEKYEPRFIPMLQKAKPIEKAIWDPGLEAVSRLAVEKNDLNPQYKGKNTLCGNSSGKQAGSLSDEALAYVCKFYTNVMNPDNVYFGDYFNAGMSSYYYSWGMSCDRKKIEFSFTGTIDSSKVDFAKLNTAKNATYMTPVERKMVAEINFARAYPKVYSKIIAKYLSDQSKAWGGLGWDEYQAGQEIMAELDTMQALSILTPMECVYKAAKNHGLVCEKRGYFAHEGNDGSWPWTRILKECTSLKSGNENGAGNVSENPRAPVISLLIDDGISSRGHRYNTLDKNWKYVGCYRYSHKENNSFVYYQWIQNFAY